MLLQNIDKPPFDIMNPESDSPSVSDFMNGV
jgi:hypothetical protein